MRMMVIDIIFFFSCFRKIRDGGRLPLYPYHPKGYRCLLQNPEKTLQWIPWDLRGPPKNWRRVDWKIQESSVSWFLIGAASHNWILKKPSEMHPFPFAQWMDLLEKYGTPGLIFWPLLGSISGHGWRSPTENVWMAASRLAGCLMSFLCFYSYFIYPPKNKI